MPKKMEENLDTEAVFPEIKDEPMSPTSSVSSRMSEPGVKRGRPPKGKIILMKFTEFNKN